MSRYRPFAYPVKAFGVNIKEFQANPNLADNTNQINAAILEAISSGRKVIGPPGVYTTTGTINLGTAATPAAVWFEGTPGFVIDHRPPNDTTDAVVVAGLDAGRTIVNGVHIKGMQGGYGYGRDLIRVSKGDYPCFYDVSLTNPKRDAFHVRPTASNQWVENMWLEHVKVQFASKTSTTINFAGGISSSDTSVTVANGAFTTAVAPFNILIENEVITVGVVAGNVFSSLTRGAEGTTAAAHADGVTVASFIGRDGFHFEVQGAWTSSYKPFINQVTLNNCETRSSTRHALMLLNTITGGTNANKLSCFTITGDTELAGEKGPHALVRLQADTQPIENISFDGCAIENTNAERTGAGIEVTGNCSGMFRVENTVIFGTGAGTGVASILGHDNFPHYYVRNINGSAYAPLYSSHTGISKKVRTAALAQNATEDVHTLIDGEWLEVLVTDQNNGSNNKTWFARATVIGRQVMVSASNFNLNVTITEVSGQLRITNTHATTKALEVFIMRVHKDTGA